MASLAENHCTSCSADASALSEGQVREHLAALPEWSLSTEGTAIHRRWKFKNYTQALDFVVRISDIAEGENHHPDIAFGWGFADVSLTTHSIGGLHRNDFIIAAKINQLTSGLHE